MIGRRVFDSRVGPLAATADERGLVELGFRRKGAAVPPRSLGDAFVESVLDAAEREIGEYFACGRRSFDVPIALLGPPFHRTVWTALLEIPYGETISYGELARRVGEPDGARAVGAANGANPIVIIVPCHRVIGADGTLVGYGGGLGRKRTLLDLEAGRLSLLDTETSRPLSRR